MPEVSLFRGIRITMLTEIIILLIFMRTMLSKRLSSIFRRDV